MQHRAEMTCPVCGRILRVTTTVRRDPLLLVVIGLVLWTLADVIAPAAHVRDRVLWLSAHTLYSLLGLPFLAVGLWRWLKED